MEDPETQDTIAAAEDILDRTREKLSIEGKVPSKAKRLAELGFNSCSIRRLEFDPKIPDPDLQIEAILELSTTKPNKESIQEGAKLLAQDFALYSTVRFGNGEELVIEDASYKNKDRWIIRPKEGTPHTLATVEGDSQGISLVFPRTSFYGDIGAQTKHRKMVDKLAEYHSERLEKTIPLANTPGAAPNSLKR